MNKFQTSLKGRLRRTAVGIHDSTFIPLAVPQQIEELFTRNLGEEPTFGGSKGRLLAAGEGFSLHAATHVHANDRDGLAKLCRYRGPIAESRLSQRGDGKYAYETKKGVTLVLTAEQLVRRLLWLIPPANFHLTSFHGLLSSHAAARAAVLPRPSAPAQPPAPRATPGARAPAGRAKQKRPTLDWAALHAKRGALTSGSAPAAESEKSPPS